MAAMHLTRWAAADPRFSTPHLLEKCARNRGQGDRGAEKRAAGACAWSLRGRCSGVGEHQVCVGWSRRVCPQSLCAGWGCRKCFGARAASHGRSEEGWVRELFARPASPGPGVQRSCPPPPAPSARPAPTSASRLFLVPGSQGRRSPGNPAGTAPPGRRCSLPRPRRRLSGAHPASQRGAGASGADMDPNPRAALERQQLRLRERQKFFEDILQPETEFVFPLSHLHLESQRPPIGSISSMEVNVDTLEQVEFIDLADQDGADVFLPCEDSPPTPQMSGVDDHPEELSLLVPTSDRTTSRTSSLSSDSSNLRSPNPSDGGGDTPLAQSDEEDGDDGGAEPGPCS